MKFQNKMISSLLVLVFASFITVGSSKESSHDINSTPMMERSLAEKHFNELTCKHNFILDFFMIFNLRDLIDELVKPKQRKLILILADDVKDAIIVAENMVPIEKRVPLEKNREDVSESQKPMYDAILENYYSYNWKKKGIRLLAFGRNMKNKVLSTYIAKKLINRAKEFIIILVASQQELKSIHHMFEATFDILGNDPKTFQNSVRFSTTSSKSNDFEILENYIKLPDINENLKLLAGYVIENHSLKNRRRQFAKKSNSNFDIVKFPLNYEYYANCFLSRINTIDNTYSLNEIRTNIHTLTGVFTLTEKLNAANRSLSEFSKCLNDEMQLGNCFEKLCNNVQHYEINELLCFINQMSHLRSDEQGDFMSTTGMLQRLTQYHLEESFRRKQSWYMKLKSIYDDRNNWNETDNLQKLQDLLEGIPGKSRFLSRGNEIMRNAYDTVKANIVKIQTNVSCLKMKNGYKMQVKGKILTLSEISSGYHCNGTVKIIELFALEKIIIDQDLIKVGDETLVIIFAPIWKVTNDHTINLDGLSRNPLLEMNLTSQAKNASLDGNRNGQNGLPGGPAGSFYGIGGTFDNGEHLLITANGANGSDGQHGGHSVGNKTYFSLGGKCGMGGKGSKKGDIRIFSLNDSVNVSIRISSMNGYDGKPGRCGRDSERYEEVKKNTIGYKLPAEITISDHFAKAVNLYKRYILSATSENDDFILLYKQLISNKNIQDTYNTFDYVEELTDLEKYYSNRKNKTSSLFLFQSWKERIRQYNKYLKESEKNDQYENVLIGLDNMISKRIRILEGKFDDRSILYIEKNLKKCFLESKKLQDAEIVVSLKNISSQFKIEFENEIEEAQHLQNELQAYVESKYDEVNSEIKSLLNEVVDLMVSEKDKRKKLDEEQKLDERKKLNDRKRELQEKIEWRHVFGVFKILCLGLAFLGPASAAVGENLAAIGSDVKSVIAGADNTNNHTITLEIPILKAVSGSLDSAIKSYDVMKETQKLIFEKILKSIQSKKRKLEKKGECVEPLNGIERTIQNLIENDTLQMEDILSNEETKWQKENESEKKNNEKAIRFLRRLRAWGQLMETFGETYGKISKDRYRIKRLNSLIQKSSGSLRQLEDFKNKIKSYMFPLMDQIRKNAVKKNDEFSLFSITYLEFEKWKTSEYLENLSSEIGNWTQGSRADDSFKRTKNELKKAIKGMINIQSLITNYIQRMNNSKYLKKPSIALFQITHIENVELSMALAELMQIHYANDVLDLYKKWMNSFMQYSFPFADEFLDVYKSPIQEVDDPQTKGKFVVERMNYFKMQIEERNAHGRILNKTSTAKFAKDLPPFYIWKRSMHLSQIKDILEGKEVKLFANISEKRNFNGIKFRKIGVYFNANDPKINDALNHDSIFFSVILTHNGDSYYRCDKKVFLISSGAQEFSDDNIVSRRKRSVKKKFHVKSDYVLSPFATWTVQVVHIMGKKDFSILNKYANLIDIELVGEGRYIHSNLDVCESDLTKFYGEEVLL